MHPLVKCCIHYTIFVDGFHLWYKTTFLEDMCRKPVFQHPDLGPSLHNDIQACGLGLDVL